MPSPSILDFPKLLAEFPPAANDAVQGDPAAPPAAHNPAGIDLRTDRSPTSLYEKTRSAVLAARGAEYEAISGGSEDQTSQDKSRVEWAKAYESAIAALTEKSKDLEITAYLIESLLRLHGFAGLRDGFRLARELIEKFWNNLYPVPAPDDGDDRVELRVRTLAQVLRAEGRSAITVPLSRVPLTEENTPLGALSQDHHRRALLLEKITDPKAKQKQIEGRSPTLEMFRDSVAQSQPAFFVNLLEDITASLDELGKLSQILDKLCGEHARTAQCDNYSPAVSGLRERLTACLDTFKEIAKSKLPAAVAPAGKTDKVGENQLPATGAAVPAVENPDAIRDREGAFRVLERVAEFFKKTEPHSVVSYSLEQVVRWGKMPLPELLSELIPDDGPRKSLFQRVGIKPAEAEKEKGKK